MLPDGCKGPKKKREFSFFNSDTRRLKLLLFVEVQIRLSASCHEYQETPQISLIYNFTYIETHAGESTVKVQEAQSFSMGQLNLEKIRAQLDLAEGGAAIRSLFSASPSEYMVHSQS